MPAFHTGLAAKQQPKYRLAALLTKAPLTSRPSIITRKDDNNHYFSFSVILDFSLGKNNINLIIQRKKIRDVVLVISVFVRCMGGSYMIPSPSIDMESKTFLMIDLCVVLSIEHHSCSVAV